MLLQNNSKQNNLWGINFLYLDDEGDFIEFDSLINIRLSQGNHSRGVESEDIQAKIIEVVNNWVTE